MRRLVPALIIALFIASALTAWAGNSGAVSYSQATVKGCPVNVISVDLNDPKVKLTAAVTKSGIGKDEPFSSFVGRCKPTAAVNGAFFSKTNLKPIGDIVIDGCLVHWGGMGTAMCITEDNRIDFVSCNWGHRMDWSEYKTVIACGPRLITDGEITLDPRGERFRDPHVLGSGIRTAVGVTAANRLLILNTRKGRTLRQLAEMMKALGCENAMNLDGGASVAMYYRGKTVSNPGRKLTNVLLIYEQPQALAGRPSTKDSAGSDQSSL